MATRTFTQNGRVDLAKPGLSKGALDFIAQGGGSSSRHDGPN